MTQRGFGIAETLIASMILAMLAVSFYTLNATVQTNIRVGNSRAVAAGLAQQELERGRWQIESAWRQSRSQLTTEPAPWDELVGNASSRSVVINGTTYTVEFSLETTSGVPPLSQAGSPLANVGQAVKRAKITVSWFDGSRARRYELFGLLTDWRGGLL